MIFELLQGVQRDAHDNENTRAAEVKRNIERAENQERHHRHERQKNRARQRDARQHGIEELRGVLAGPDARDKAARFLQVVRDTIGLKMMAV